MADIIVPNVGKKDLLTWMREDYEGSGMYTAGMELRLFQNDVSPDLDTALADVTEATFSGYGYISDWNIDKVSAPIWNADKSQISIFICGGCFSASSSPAVTNTIYGWYLTIGEILMISKFDESISVTDRNTYPVTVPSFYLCLGNKA